MEQEHIRILLVDDDQGDFEMTRAMATQVVSPPLALTWASSSQEALRVMQDDPHDLYLLDYFLEDGTGLDLLRAARERGIRAPMILLTGRSSREVDMEAMAAGADDYLVKGQVGPELLERTIRYAMERHRAQEELRDSEERHRSMFDHLPIGLYRASSEGHFMEANPALVRMLGYPDRETLQRVYSRKLFVSPDDRNRFLELLERFGVVRGFETELIRLDGRPLRVRNTARAHKGPNGDVRYLEGALEDVTDLTRAVSLQESDARLRTLLRITRSGVGILDLQGRLLQTNPSLDSILGRDTEDLAGTLLTEFLHLDEQDEMAREIRALGGGSSDGVHGEHRFILPDGGTVWARLALTRVRTGPASDDELLLLLEDPGEGSG
ncbi:MAG: PAS domain S-box protein [Gemmatimonadota bacterium]